MPPNKKGGKGYKKKASSSAEDSNALYIDRGPDQMVARVLRKLGDRNMLVFCNDNKVRICHICGKMKGRVWINPGDVVLVSLRDFGGSKQTDRGDIIAMYLPEHYGKLRKEDGVNPKVFMSLETMEGMTLQEIGEDKTNMKLVDDVDDLFERDGDEEESSEEEKVTQQRADVSKATSIAMTNARALQKITEDIDIDAL
jgi:translation initiation factor 1A